MDKGDAVRVVKNLMSSGKGPIGCEGAIRSRVSTTSRPAWYVILDKGNGVYNAGELIMALEDEMEVFDA